MVAEGYIIENNLALSCTCGHWINSHYIIAHLDESDPWEEDEIYEYGACREYACDCEEFHSESEASDEEVSENDH